MVVVIDDLVFKVGIGGGRHGYASVVVITGFGAGMNSTSGHERLLYKCRKAIPDQHEEYPLFCTQCWSAMV